MTDPSQPLTERERTMVERLLAATYAFPNDFKTWLKAQIELDPPRLLARDIQGETGVYPRLVDVDVFPTAIAHTNWDSIDAATAGRVYNASKFSSGVVNDEINFDVVLGGGTWTLELMHAQDINRGIYTITLDGTAIGTVDGYTAAAANNTRSAIAGIRISVAAKRRLKLKMQTKNAAATAYYGVIQHIQFRRTS